MKKSVFVISALVLSCFSTVATAGSISEFFGLASVAKVNELEKEVENLTTQNELLKKDIANLESQLGAKLTEIKGSLKKQQSQIKDFALNQQGLLHAVNENTKAIQTSQEIIFSVNGKVAELSQSYNQLVKKEVAPVINENQNKINWELLLSVLVGFLSIGIYLTLRKQIASNKKCVSDLQTQSNGILEYLAAEAEQLDKIASLTKTTQEVKTTSPDVNHELIKTLADRITFMQITLYRMDKSIRGHKQLSKTINQMKDNLLANGYEIVDMLGQRYHEGMKVVANFIEDEDLPQGDQIITGIIKPQINYKGVMIQSAQITVSQNV